MAAAVGRASGAGGAGGEGGAAKGGAGKGSGAPSQRPRDLPWWVPWAVYPLAAVVLFGGFIFSDQMLFGLDTIEAGGYMARAYFAERLAAGDFPLWGTRLLGGLPFMESLSGGDAVYPASLLYYLTEPYRALGWKLVLHVLAGGFFMHGWLRSAGMGRHAALAGGLAWLMAPVIVTLVLPGNDGKLMVASLAPLVFWAAETVLRKPSGRTGVGLAAAVALTSLTTQFQTAYFLFGSAAAYAVFRTARLWQARTGARRFTPAGFFFAFALLGGGLAAFQLVPAASYVVESSRRTATTVEARSPEEARAYSSSWSLHPEEAVSLVVPEFVGNSYLEAEWGAGTYWGRNSIKLNHEYLGVTVLAFALFALAKSKRGGRRRSGRSRRRRDRGRGGRAALDVREGRGNSSIGPEAPDGLPLHESIGFRWFMAGLSLVWLLFALGEHTPVWRIFYEVVPGISLFRAPSLSAFLVSLGVTTLFAAGVDDLVRGRAGADGFFRSARGRVLGGFVALLALGFLLQASGGLERFWTTVVYPDASPGSVAALGALQPHITAGAGIAVLLAVLSVATIWGAVERKLPVTVAVAAVAVLVAVDLGRINRAFIRNFDYHEWAAPDANTRFLSSQQESEPPFRVADLRGSVQNVELAMHGFDLVGGHHPNDLARYRQLLGLEGSTAQGANTSHPNVLQMLNVKYFAWSLGGGRGPPYEGAQALSTAPSRVRSGVTDALYAYPGLERAWVVGSATVEDEDGAALAAILSPGFDPGREAILARSAMAMPEMNAATGTVVWEADGADERLLRVQTDGPGLLIVSENWFPGWEATVNGVEADVLRANLTLQAVALPSAGEHVVALRYTAPSVKRALMVSLASLGVAVLIFAVSVLRRRRAGST